MWQIGRCRLQKASPDEDFAYLSLCSEACQVEEAAVVPGLEEDAIFRLPEGVAKQQGKEDAEDCRSEDAPLFNTALNWEVVQT